MLTLSSSEPHSRPVVDKATRIMGMHRIVPLAYEGADVQPLWNALAERADQDASDAAAMVDLSMILQSHGRTEDAMGLLLGALEMQRDFCVVHGDGSGLKLLAFVTPGDFMANTPLDFLLNGSNTVLWLRYVDGETTELNNLPDHDVAFMAIGEANENGGALERIKGLLVGWTGPIMNNDPGLINGLTRDGVSAMFADEPTILSPMTYRLERAALEAVANGAEDFGPESDGLKFPIIVRPIGTHAGNGMERLGTAETLADYLGMETARQLYVAPFIDYRGEDGLYNKQRVVLIKGKPFPSHMALSQHWMVHYLSAGMAESAEKRGVEAQWMEDFDTDFAMRHADAFAALYRRIGLDYFGIDCAELPDGRLLMFEMDVAMIVHDMDSAEVYPYKKVAMQKLFDAFVASVADHAKAHAARLAVA